MDLPRRPPEIPEPAPPPRPPLLHGGAPEYHARGHSLRHAGTCDAGRGDTGRYPGWRDGFYHGGQLTGMYCEKCVAGLA